MTIKKETAAESVKFTKDKLLRAAIFSERKDVLGAVIKDGEELTTQEAQARLEKFMKGKVN